MARETIGETIPLDPSCFPHYARLLTGAFEGDPLYIKTFPDPKRRDRALTWMHGRVLRYCSLYGLAYTLPDADGLACWLPPGQTEITMGRIVRSGLIAMPLVFGPASYRRFDLYMSFSGRLRDEHAPESYWYLWLLGVAPRFQRKGVGGRLMKPVLDEADSRGQACFLETEDERNVELYNKHGFKVIAEALVPGLQLSTWSMLRSPS